MNTYELTNGQVIHNLTNGNKKLLDFLLKTKDDADDLFYNFVLNSVNENIAVSDYRLHRVEQRNVGLQEFLDMFEKEDENKALRELFMYSVTNEEVEKLMTKISEGKTTIVKIYYRHINNRRARLLRFLL